MPDHHLADKAALAVEGYEALTAALHTAWAADNDPADEKKRM